MAFFEVLNNIDTQVLLGVNGTHTAYLDTFFALFTSKEVWFPLYLVLLIVIFSKYKRTGIWLVITLILTIVVTDQASVFIKNLVMRFRPSHAPSLQGLLNLPVGEGGLYGFVSSHAANAFALVVLIALLSKCSRVWIALLVWAVVTGYSRIYLGVHYPLDVLAGAALGALVGWGMYHLLMLTDQYLLKKRIAFSGSCENHQVRPILITLVTVTVTLAIAAMLVLKYNL